MKSKTIKVAILLSEHPFPPNSGTRVKNYHLWKHFKNMPDIEIKIFYLSDSQDGSNFSGMDEEAFSYDKMGFINKVFRYLFFSHHQYRHSGPLKDKLKKLIVNWSPDIIHAEELKMAKYTLDFDIKKTVTLHNVESDLLKKTGSLPVKYFQSLLNFIHLTTLKNYERKVVQAFNKVFTYSKIDTERLIDLYGKQSFSTTQNGVNATDVKARSIENMKTVLFIGSLHYAPNAEGIKWFIKEVMPNLNQDIRIVVAGAGAPSELIEQFISQNIIFYDSPQSLEAIYQNCTITIVPLLNGSGTRTKILESMAYQRPVVSTTKGSEGLDVSSDLGVFNIDRPRDFAAKINDLCHENQRQELDRLGHIGRKFVLENYDWKHLAKQYYDEWMSL